MELKSVMVVLLRALVVCTILIVSNAGPALSFGKVSNVTESFGSRRELLSKKQPTFQNKLSGCGTGNPIADCWQCDPNWAQHRQELASCAVGFGQNAGGGRNGAIYVVTDPGDDNPTNPAPGTIRYAAIQLDPLWIIFDHDMTITLKEELIVTSYKTFDGRGANVHIAYGACFTLQFISNVIIHGLHIHDCKSTGPARVASSTAHVGQRGVTDGDGVNIFGSSDLWIDQNYLSNCADGLVDVIMGSNSVTISNNYFTNHDKVMLLGAHDTDYQDKNLQVTVAFNYFGPGLTQRLPRCRLGYFHVVNNYYSGWGIYAIGGSANPTINSEGNHFDASGSPPEVTKDLDNTGNWRSVGDLFVNGAYFSQLGDASTASIYNRATSFSPIPASQVPAATAGAGPTS
ncbi:unnamed protein product [Calypogeia fissa]